VTVRRKGAYVRRTIKPGPFRLRIAYLVNCYPAPSHSFVRREIAGVEAAGVEVLRYSIRPAPDSLPDPRDAAERDVTTFVLARGMTGLFGALIAEAVMHPLGFAHTLGRAFAMARASWGDAWRQLAYLAEAAWLCRDWRRHRVTHVHAHFGTNPAAVARLARAWGGPRYSFTVHGPDEFDTPLSGDLSGKIADSAFVAAISSYGRSQLMRWSRDENWSKIRVVRCGVDASFIDQPASDPPDNAALCCVARLSPQKGLHILVEAVARIAPERPDLKVVIVGDGPLRASLEGQAAALGVTGNIVFAGVASGDAVRQHLLDARAFVLPSFAEGLPVVLMEALALRRPVITTWVAGIPELVDARVGWLVPPGDVAALADAIGVALDAPPAALAAMGDAGRARVQAAHDAAANGAQMADLIRASAA
jgi:colanic acid/amylovoran biosynthesis glycosyltransferase